MYTIQAMNTTGPTAMNHVPLPEPSPPIASDFYFTNYGVARNIWVTKEGYKRFFEIADDDYLVGWMLYIQKKISETLTVIGDVRGWVLDEKTEYVITFIDYSHGALMDHAVRTKVQSPDR